ncbi:hypothetical protein U1Q18_002092 [Sarracenia purpurea var. burkii]
MAQIGKKELQIEHDCPADKFFEIFTTKTSLIPSICPEKIKSVEVLQGDGASVGSVRLWKGVLENSDQSATERIEAIDKDNKSVTFETLEGDMTKNHKAIKFTLHAMPKGKGCLVTWIMEYEKPGEDIAAPTKYLDFTVGIGKDIDAFLQKA